MCASRIAAPDHNIIINAWSYQCNGRCEVGGCSERHVVDMSECSEVVCIASHAFEGRDVSYFKNFPTTVSTFGEYAFAGLPIIVFRAPLSSQLQFFEARAFSMCHLLGHVDLSHAGSRGQSVYFKTECFRGCRQLKSFVFPPKLYHIGDSCFRDTGLESVELPASVVTVGNKAFAECPLLTFFKFRPLYDTFIGTFVLSECASLRSAIVPNLAEGMFYSCASLESVQSGGSIVCSKALAHCPRLCRLNASRRGCLDFRRFKQLLSHSVTNSCNEAGIDLVVCLRSTRSWVTSPPPFIGLNAFSATRIPFLRIETARANTLTEFQRHCFSHSHVRSITLVSLEDMKAPGSLQMSDLNTPSFYRTPAAQFPVVAFHNDFDLEQPIHIRCGRDATAAATVCPRQLFCECLQSKLVYKGISSALRIAGFIHIGDAVHMPGIDHAYLFALLIIFRRVNEQMTFSLCALPSEIYLACLSFLQLPSFLE